MATFDEAHMIRLMLCDKCGYMGDLSDLPQDRDLDAEFAKMSGEEAKAKMAEILPKSRSMFHLIGWTSPKPGRDLCPGCSPKAKRPHLA